MRPGAGAQVDQPVRGAHRFLIMLDHEDGVPQIAQPVQGGNEALVVTLMQADAWFVEHVEHAGQSGSNLGRQTYPLRLAAGERAHFAIESEVTQPHVGKEFQPRSDLLDRFGSDKPLLRGKFNSLKPRPRPSDRECAKPVDGGNRNPPVSGGRPTRPPESGG